ncbi:hypothetical protein L207DRAFT_506463 [Hyaloscypha variabilis F]|uniref:Uncharacterized protein n=1 Tax=Hyaloscypha variabilis (strain UAMH 11265 / GT02V1 / F) TaxID=1149755 RepID=A0A2J6S9M2_HYAVF|nr:hypothetical protein L207DRAFT_506463 [Hyaloscypha variabilis F]
MIYNFSPSKDIISLENTDVGPFCGKEDSAHRWTHRMECHKASYEAACKRNSERGRSTPEMKKKCRTGWSSGHCECYTRHMRLHRRLNSWMPENFRYCGRCGMFTKRKKQNNNRCYHGLPRERENNCRYWTHTSVGGASGRRIWNRWSKRRAIKREEARMRRDRESQRKGGERYSMRKLEPKARNSNAVSGRQ